MNPEKLNSEEKLEKKGDLTPEIVEETGEKIPSNFALAVVENIKAEEANFYHETETILRENPNFSEDQIAQLKEVLNMARQVADSTQEEILKLVESETPPPIKDGEIFNAEEEFKQIRSKKLSSDEKRKKFEEFNKKLGFQKLGLSMCQGELIKSIYKDSGLSFDELWKIVKNYSLKFGFDYGEFRQGGIGSSINKGILGDFESMIRKYLEIRKLNAAIKNEYKGGEELFANAFGEPPKGKVETIFSPLTICFRCYDVEDFAKISFGGRELTPEMIKRAESDIGCFVRWKVRIPLSDADFSPLLGPYIITINNTGDIFEDEKKSKIVFPMAYFHEEQHAINFFIRSESAFFRRERHPESGEAAMSLQDFVKNFHKSKTDEDRSMLLEKYFQQERKADIWEEEAKNEIMAFIKEGIPPDIIYEALSKPEEGGGAYDYFRFQKKRFSEDLTKEFGEEYKELIRAAIKKVYDDEYPQLIREAIDSYVVFHRAGFSNDEIIALFQKEQLVKWPKLIEKLSRIKK